jgi:hypothetical protein
MYGLIGKMKVVPGRRDELIVSRPTQLGAAGYDSPEATEEVRMSTERKLACSFGSRASSPCSGTPGPGTGPAG